MRCIQVRLGFLTPFAEQRSGQGRRGAYTQKPFPSEQGPLARDIWQNRQRPGKVADHSDEWLSKFNRTETGTSPPTGPRPCCRGVCEKVAMIEPSG